MTAQTAVASSRLAELLDLLKARHYAFVTPTPATHAIVIGRDPQRQAHSLADILGWSMPFRRDRLDPAIFAVLGDADALSQSADQSPSADRLWRSAIRVSSLGANLFIHSAFPTDAQDAVFFGPDSYRFADAIAAELARQPVGSDGAILDIGTGTGVGAIVAATASPGATVTMTDINPAAMTFARINAAAAGIATRGIVAPDLAAVAGSLDLILANPPYIADPAGRAYRDGGGSHGSGVALAMTAMALPRLRHGGRLLLYTGSAIVNGQDRLQDQLRRLADDAQCRLRYREVDPDVFGEELVHPAYHDVDRIAVVVAVFTAPMG